MAVTEPVPVTLPPVGCPLVAVTGVPGWASGRLMVGMASTSALVSVGWGRTGGARALLDGGPEAVSGSNWREGTVVIFSVWTSKDGTFVTVPDCTVSPGDADKLSLGGCTGGGSTGTGAAMEWGTAPREFVLVKKKANYK